jgi:UDP-N-acetylmuramate: L-alanyl-gamma-D-glutamyl-meso-diaminopimelate ligase
MNKTAFRMNVHFIAIGGAAMHNLAIALHNKAYHVTGSDSEIFEPSRGRLDKYGLLPKEMGWNADHIQPELDAVILGMKAKSDNPELIRAQELGLKIHSYPEFLFEQAKDKRRLVIAGSHGKTTITSIVLHVCNKLNLDVDYMVGAQLDGYETMVRLSGARDMILEGDEYLSSPLDLRSKFIHYRPHVAILSGIAWDHINVFPTYESYFKCFEDLLDVVEQDGHFIYCEEDPEVQRLIQEYRGPVKTKPYGSPAYEVKDGRYWVEGKYAVGLAGQHNMQNLEAARSLCEHLGVDREGFYSAVEDFEGAARRMEVLHQSEERIVYRDFAHSPSKLKATVKAVKEQYPDRKLSACIELHTYSSLNKDFLPQYEGSLNAADEAVVFYSPETIRNKGMKEISPADILEGFQNSQITVLTESADLAHWMNEQKEQGENLLLMSSGNFGGVNVLELFS